LVVGKGLAILATVLRVIGLIIVAILVVHILLTVFDANPANAFASFIRDAANTLSLGVTNLFTPANPKVAVAVNYGIAAAIWLVITTVVVGVLGRIGTRAGAVKSPAKTTK
jgi:hypothetical protein